ncbi:MAG: SPOR domain-containing protein [Parvibaculum sp.]
MPTLGRDEDEHYELEASDEFHTYDATEQGGGGRVLLILVGIFVIVGLFGSVLFLAYQQGMKEGSRNAPPLIEADNSPIKIVPDDPGGLEVPNTDKLIYDRLNGREATPDGVEQLLPQAEEPMRIEAQPAPARPTAPVVPATPRDRIEVLPPPVSITPDPETQVPAPAGATPVPGVPVPIVPTRPDPEVLPTVRTVPVVPAQPVAPAATSGATGGNFVVQIAAFRDLRQAEGEFDKLRAAHPELMTGLVRDVQRANLGAQGIYYRLRVGWFETNDAAKSLCARLQAKGQDCIVRPK